MTEARVLDLVGIAPIHRQGAAEQVARRLLSLVQSGTLRAGDQLPAERELATNLGVSRPVVREALRGLSILGVLRVRPGGGAFISPLEAADLLAPLQFFISLDRYPLDALFDARTLIEGGIAARAAQRATPAQIAQLREMVSSQRQLIEDAAGFRASDRQFHQMLMDAAGNPFLTRVALGLNALGMDFRPAASERPDVLQGSVEDHGQILAAIERGEPEQAQAAMEEHMHHIRRSTEAAMAGAGPDAADRP